jgi:hypothetical protein
LNEKSRNFLFVEIKENSLENLGTLDFHEIWPAGSRLHLIARRNQFPSEEDQKVEFHSE